MARAMAYLVAYPMAYPMVHPKVCNFTNFEEKINTYVYRDQALEIRAIAVFFFFKLVPKPS